MPPDYSYNFEKGNYQVTIKSNFNDNKNSKSNKFKFECTEDTVYYFNTNPNIMVSVKTKTAINAQLIYEYYYEEYGLYYKFYDNNLLILTGTLKKRFPNQYLPDDSTAYSYRCKWICN